MREKDEILHAGELEAQERFGASKAWSTASLNRMIRQTLDAGIATFVEAQPFFFIATADDRGNCDASFRSTERGVGGEIQPVVRVIDERTMVFPDYSGNKLYNSLGNILVNPHIGILFIDFERALRLRINGGAEIIEDPSAFADVWSTALRYVRVTVDQVYGNCPQRIPRLKPLRSIE
jgi:predicted pyridoxine 5'-phosphate oxidase superfamily flavin-nucleotide-binding protein